MPVDATMLHRLHDRPAAEAIELLRTTLAEVSAHADAAPLRALARALPDSVASLSPEVCRLTAQLALALTNWQPRVPNDIAELVPVLRVDWHRVALACDSARWLPTLDVQELGAVTRDWPLTQVLKPLPILRTLASAPDRLLRLRALERLPSAVEQLGITRPEARQLWSALASDAEPTIRARALRAVGDGWLPTDTNSEAQIVERSVVGNLDHEDEAVARAAIGAAAHLGAEDPLLALTVDAKRPPAIRAQALAECGDFATQEVLEVALELSAESPLEYAAAARRCIEDAHRRGVFLRAQHLPALLDAFDRHAGWTASKFVRVTHIVRNEVVEQLATLRPDAAQWHRRAALLGETTATGAPALLAKLLRAKPPLDNAAAFIDAASRNPNFTDAAALLGWLDALPHSVLPALLFKGTAEHYPEVRRVVLAPQTPNTTRTLALRTAKALAPDREALIRKACEVLGPHDSGLLKTAHQGRRGRAMEATTSELRTQLLLDRPWPDTEHNTVSVEHELRALCGAGTLAALDRVQSLFRTRLQHIVQAALNGDFSIKRTQLPILEQTVYEFGERLVTNEYRVRHYATTRRQSGRDLLVGFVFDWLDEQPPATIAVALLEILARHRLHGAQLRRLEPFWRTKDTRVQRAALEAILAVHADREEEPSSPGDDGAQGLELSLCRLVEHDDARIVVQALAAVRDFAARWAEPMVLRALNHPSMAVKKAAAEALSTIASTRAIGALVGWLARHDNGSFRALLVEALKTAAGSAYVAVLVDRLHQQREQRSIDLLGDALSGVLPMAAAIRLARDTTQSHTTILEHCLDGRIQLSNASATDLAAQLHRAELQVATPQTTVGRALRVQGFSSRAALALVEERLHPPSPLPPRFEATILNTVRTGLAEWIRWLDGEGDTARVTAVALVADALTRQHTEHFESVLTLVDRCRAKIRGASTLGFIARCFVGDGTTEALRIRAIEVLRRSAHDGTAGGLECFRLLGRLGAVRTFEDLWSCLQGSRAGPRAESETTALLSEALQLPAKTDNEPSETRALREGIEAFLARGTEDRAAWLRQVVADRPLGLPPTPDDAARTFERRSDRTGDARRQFLLAQLRGDDPAARERAAAALLDWADVRDDWPKVFDAFMQGRIECPTHRQRLAGLLSYWPTDAKRRDKATLLVKHCPPWQRRQRLSERIETWEAGDTSEHETLRGLPESELLPLVWQAVERGRFAPTLLLRANQGRPIQALVAHLAQHSPEHAEHLRVPDPADAPTKSTSGGLDDPIEGTQPQQLRELIADRATADGVAVRAVHALQCHDALSPQQRIDTLDELVTDRRPAVRSAALRLLRKLAPRSRSLEAALRVLQIESRRDVRWSLMRSLAHGRHQAALPQLIERLYDTDPKTREAACDALRVFGEDAESALRKARRRARPDRRAAIDAILESL